MQKPILIKYDTLKPKLLGDWGGYGENTPVWRFTEDSVYYYGEKRNYAYTLKGNNVVIHRNKSDATLKDIVVINDTIFFNDESGMRITGIRFKN